jgi:DNA ligase-1
LLEPITLENEAQLEQIEAQWLAQGYEGVMMRHTSGPYKCGRSSMNEGYLMKLKRFSDAEAVVIGFQEEMFNANVAMKDAFGRTKRSSHAGNKTGKGTLGALIVRRESDGVEFNVGTGMDNATRLEIWENQGKYLNQLVKYKWFQVGTDERPRHPVFLGFRDINDL